MNENRDSEYSSDEHIWLDPFLIMEEIRSIDRVALSFNLACSKIDS